MTQKELLTYALDSVNDKLKRRCRYVADGTARQDDIDAVINLIRDRSDIMAKLTKGDA